MTPLFLDSLVLSLQTLGRSPKGGPWNASSPGYRTAFGVGQGLEGGETVSGIKYVGNANLNYVALSPSETSQKLTYAILLGSSQDCSNHMRIPVEKDWLWSMGLQRVRHNWATELNWRQSGNLRSPERAGAAKVRWRFQEIQGSLEFESWRCHRHLQPRDKSLESSLETLDPFACAPAASWKDNSRASLPSVFSFLDNCLSRTASYQSSEL